VTQAGIKIFLHTMFVAAHVEEGRLDAIVVENKSGRGAIKAAQFVDASGDGDLAARLGLETYFSSQMQPATTCARLSNLDTMPDVDMAQVLHEHGEKFGLPEGFAWGCMVPNSDVYMLAGTRIYGANPAIADDLTQAEIEGRRQVRAIMDIFKHVSPQSRVSLQGLPSRIGLRESRHVKCGYQLTGDDVLHGHRFEDAIANGSYRVDIHHHDKPGITLRYLDGREEYSRPGFKKECSRWREPTTTNPVFYQVPLRSLVPGIYPNLIMAGRMMDADPIAHAGVRVMVNMNQTGEAAGVAAWLALQTSTPIPQLNAQNVRNTLAQGGSIVI